ncbi:hypothetical protein AUR04nite_29860 [Glutamicibacter uratoxydans]|uniref:Uncharacterized protein n=1 Tax=Glutamicibacter uratoxydans TaxID=43667 RepID=A0A4Y4DU99_GLUUR|nr:hypothetical protein [Glutamicibacter uratoxydans]GED07454.1 hypothetical protein AUR04nite_29860 [Glutamicibacter uratoxydans]
MQMELDDLRSRVEYLLAANRESQALELLRDNLSEHQGSPDYWALYSACQLNTQDYAGAMSTAQAALALEPEHPSGLEFLAISLNSLKRRAEALDAIIRLVNLLPEYARGHYWYAMILVGSIQSKDERVLARQAAEHALKLEPENPLFFQGAAIAAEIAGDNRAALNYLHEGLKIAPHDEGLLRAAGSIDNAERITGEKSKVLRGLLSSNPMNESLHEDFAEAFVEKQGIYAQRFWLFLPALAIVPSLAGARGISQSLMGLAVVLLSTGLFALWNVRSFKRAAHSLPAGYLKDIGGRHRLLRPAWYLYGASLVLGILGAGLGCFGIADVLGAVLLLCAVAAAQAAAVLVYREKAGVPHGQRDPEAVRRLWLKLSGSFAEGFWKRLLSMVVLLVYFALCVPGQNRFAAVPLGAIAMGMFVVVGGLTWALFKLGLSNNAFAYGMAISTSARRRGSALLRGNISGLYYIGIHLLLGTIAAGLSLSVMIGGASLFESSKPAEPADQLNEKELNDLRNNLRTHTPVAPSFEVPDFPTIQPVPLDQ